MALIKNKEVNNSGVTGEYWRIVETNISYESTSARVVLALYVDEQARTDGKSPIYYQDFVWSGDEFPFSISELSEANPVHIAYVKIKESKLDDEENETNWFADAVDD
jgi:hypothetical protein